MGIVGVERPNAMLPHYSHGARSYKMNSCASKNQLKRASSFCFPCASFSDEDFTFSATYEDDDTIPCFKDGDATNVRQSGRRRHSSQQHARNIGHCLRLRMQITSYDFLEVKTILELGNYNRRPGRHRPWCR